MFPARNPPLFLQQKPARGLRKGSDEHGHPERAQGRSIHALRRHPGRKDTGLYFLVESIYHISISIYVSIYLPIYLSISPKIFTCISVLRRLQVSPNHSPPQQSVWRTQNNQPAGDRRRIARGTVTSLS